MTAIPPVFEKEECLHDEMIKHEYTTAGSRVICLRCGKTLEAISADWRDIPL